MTKLKTYCENPNCPNHGNALKLLSYFECHRCGGVFCPDCRLPENHYCSYIPKGELKDRKQCQFPTCRKTISEFAPKCGRCEKLFCYDHILPKDHQCPGSKKQ
jgi:predicted nucleic acid binding AN1-type Zn finger protein